MRSVTRRLPRVRSKGEIDDGDLYQSRGGPLHRLAGDPVQLLGPQRAAGYRDGLCGHGDRRVQGRGSGDRPDVRRAGGLRRRRLCDRGQGREQPGLRGGGVRREAEFHNGAGGRRGRVSELCHRQGGGGGLPRGEPLFRRRAGRVRFGRGKKSPERRAALRGVQQQCAPFRRAGNEGDGPGERTFVHGAGLRRRQHQRRGAGAGQRQCPRPLRHLRRVRHRYRRSS